MKKIGKLPKWAQKEIQTLEMKLLEKNNQISDMMKNLSGEKNSTLQIRLHGKFEFAPLPENATLRIWLKDNHVEFYVEDGRIVAYGSRQFIVCPHASNLIMFTFAEEHYKNNP